MNDESHESTDEDVQSLQCDRHRKR